VVVELIARLQERTVVMAAAHLEVLATVAELDRSGAWRRDGAVSMAQWLATHHGLSHATAAEWVRVAGMIDELPELRAGFAAGEVSWDQLRTATRYATAETDTEVAVEARWASVRTLQRRVRDRADASIHDLETARRSRYLRWWFDEERHTFRLEGRLPEDDGILVATALGRLTTAGPRDPNSGVHEPWEMKAADALTQLASQSLGVDSDPDRAQVVVHVAAGDLAADTGSGDTGSGEVENGPVLPVETIRRLSCDGRLQGVVEDEAGTAVGIGRTSRTIPPWLRRQIRHRDGGCRFPGCERTRFVHSHHLVHWARGGPTDLDNLVTLCPYHHRLIHEGGWRIQGDTNRELSWHHPDGARFKPKDLYWHNVGPRPDTAYLPHRLWPTTTRATADTS
jgi:hypothetical protein